MNATNEELEAIGIPREFNIITGTNGHRRKMKFLITGGCGYFAFKLAKSLHSLGACVSLLDIQLPTHIEKELNSSLSFIRGDICNYSSVLKALHNIDFVFHVASFGMSGTDQLVKSTTEAVNVTGTANVLKACREEGVERLVYTSSYNVVLSHHHIPMGDESTPYADPDEMVDYYSKTKLKADKMVLDANGSAVAGGGTLKTCCLRPSAIYGPGEKKHMARIANLIEKNMIVMKPGNAMIDWVHVSNLVQIHLLAVQGLSSASNYAAVGQAYFVSDNRPVRMCDFLEPLFESLNRKVPQWTCPFPLIYLFAFLNEFLFQHLGSVLNIPLILTRNEVLKVCITHYHSMEKAMKELGYRPKLYDYADTVAVFMKERKKQSIDEPSADDASTLMHGWKFLLFLVVLFLCLPTFASFY